VSSIETPAKAKSPLIRIHDVDSAVGIRRADGDPCGIGGTKPAYPRNTSGSDARQEAGKIG